jgi:formamidopyrimidine-DNA glycosylase
MPELPEVETLVRQLRPLVRGARIERARIADPRWCAPAAPAALQEALAGDAIEELSRRGKYLLWRLASGRYLLQHLRMTGVILFDPPALPAHLAVALELSLARPRGRAKRALLAISDPRRFGTGQLFGEAAALERHLGARLGPEPLSDSFSASSLRAALRGRRAPVKALLLDQRVVAGVGNIYADEALFGARIHPARPARMLTGAQALALHAALREALLAGISARGATIDDFRHIDGVRGSFQDRFRVHRRAGQPCPVCGGPINKLRVAGRGTYVCERCQPPPRGSRARAGTRGLSRAR